MRFRFPIVALCLFLACPSAHACLHWDDKEPGAAPGVTPGVPYPEATPVVPSIVGELQAHTDKATWQQRADERQKVADTQWDFATQNNLAVALAHSGHLDEALDRLNTVERVHVNHPYTAYNLGTVYELKGDLPHALEWTKKGIERELATLGHNPLDGTEWLHVHILEAEVANQKDATWLTSHSVSGLDFGKRTGVEAPPAFPQGLEGQTLTLPEVRRSLFGQLHERLEFVPAPNPVVGSLLADLGSVVAIESRDSDKDTRYVGDKQASELYQLALTYSVPNTDLVQSRFDFYAGTPSYTLYYAFLVMGCAAGAHALWQRYEAKKRAWEAEQAGFLEAAPPLHQTAHIDWKDYNPHGPTPPPKD